MRRLILVLTLPLMIFIFSLAPNAGAQFDLCTDIPDGVRRAYWCGMDCPCLEGDPDPQCKACDKLEAVFDGIERCPLICLDPVPPRF